LLSGLTIRKTISALFIKMKAANGKLEIIVFDIDSQATHIKVYL